MDLPHSSAHLPSSARQLPAESHSFQEAVQWWGKLAGDWLPILLCDLGHITSPLWALVSLSVKGVAG